ncbi:MAG: hypothetical protein RID81_07170 [Sandaracinaceae bacterium]
MAMGFYEGPGEVYFDGRLMGEANRVRFRLQSNNNPVHNFRKGLAGRSKGPRQSELTVEQAIPKAGMQADFVGKCKDDENVRIVVVVGRKRYTFDGWIDDCEVSQGVQEDAGFSFNVTAGPPTIR